MPDHRRLGRELDLFATDPLVGAGLPFLLPDGAVVRHTLEEYVRDLERRAGYQHVYSPVLGKRALYERSGHWAHYREDMFPPMTLGGEELVLRPSLCPHHALVYRFRARSHHELPLRIAELGGMYRAERSGVLGGLNRVRAIQFNDAHLFCTPDQVAAEAHGALELIRQVHRDLGLRPARYRLSLPEENRPGWDRAVAWLVEALDRSGIAYEPEAGEAAFYGPKIDVQVVNNAGRECTLSTVQADFHQPERFDLRYTGPDGAAHRPVLVHRSVLGSLERAMALLVEVHGGAFPPWLAPVQVLVLPVSEAQLPEAASVVRRCLDAGLRAELAAPGRGSLGARIRAGRLVPYQAVLGAAEAGNALVALRLRDGRQVPALAVGEFLDRVSARIGDRGSDLWG